MSPNKCIPKICQNTKQGEPGGIEAEYQTWNQEVLCLVKTSGTESHPLVTPHSTG